MTEEKIQAFIECEYKFYSKDIIPYIDLVEVYFGAVPDGLLNEIRNFTGHISSAAIEKSDDTKVRIENINDAHRHLRRIFLDCLKLMCIHQQDYINTFQKKYRYYNTNDVDDGNFDVFLHKKSMEADKIFKSAKDTDNTGSNDKTAFRFSLDTEISTDNIVGALGLVYEKYCEAYNTYCEAVDYINKHYEGVVRVAKKHIFTTIATWAGWVISIALSVILFFLGK